MTYDEIREAALERVREFGETGGMQEATMLRRIGLRQSQLFMRAGSLNPDFYGTCVIATLDSDASCDLALLVSPLNPIGIVERIEVYDHGTSDLTNGQSVYIVPLNGADDAIPPRVTIRDLVLKPVGTDLAGVAKLEIFYAKLSQTVGPTQGSDPAQLREPFSDLLVLDLARYILKFQMAQGKDGLDGAVKVLEAEEAPLLADYEQHVRGFILDPQDRFRRAGNPIT